MTPNELIKILKEYDFKKNSVRSFSLKYKITEKTVLKYLKEHNIPYNNRKISYEMTRNCLGQYTFKNDVNKVDKKFCQNPSDAKTKSKTNSVQQSSTQFSNLNHQMVSNKKNPDGRVKNFTEFSKKYEKFFQGTS